MDKAQVIPGVAPSGAAEEHSWMNAHEDDFDMSMSAQPTATTGATTTARARRTPHDSAAGIAQQQQHQRGQQHPQDQQSASQQQQQQQQQLLHELQQQRQQQPGGGLSEEQIDEGLLEASRELMTIIAMSRQQQQFPSFNQQQQGEQQGELASSQQLSTAAAASQSAAAGTTAQQQQPHSMVVISTELLPRTTLPLSLSHMVAQIGNTTSLRRGRRGANTATNAQQQHIAAATSSSIDNNNNNSTAADHQRIDGTTTAATTTSSGGGGGGAAAMSMPNRPLKHHYPGTAAMRKPKTQWTGEEVAVLYSGLRQFGTNFGLIANLLPLKARPDVVQQFKHLERCDPKGVADALAPQNAESINVDAFMNAKAEAARVAMEASAVPLNLEAQEMVERMLEHHSDGDNDNNNNSANASAKAPAGGTAQVSSGDTNNHDDGDQKHPVKKERATGRKKADSLLETQLNSIENQTNSATGSAAAAAAGGTMLTAGGALNSSGGGGGMIHRVPGAAMFSQFAATHPQPSFDDSEFIKLGSEISAPPPQRTKRQRHMAGTAPRQRYNENEPLLAKFVRDGRIQFSKRSVKVFPYAEPMLNAPPSTADGTATSTTGNSKRKIDGSSNADEADATMGNPEQTTDTVGGDSAVSATTPVTGMTWATTATSWTRDGDEQQQQFSMGSRAGTFDTVVTTDTAATTTTTTTTATRKKTPSRKQQSAPNHKKKKDLSSEEAVAPLAPPGDDDDEDEFDLNVDTEEIDRRKRHKKSRKEEGHTHKKDKKHRKHKSKKDKKKARRHEDDDDDEEADSDAEQDAGQGQQQQQQHYAATVTTTPRMKMRPQRSTLTPGAVRQQHEPQQHLVHARSDNNSDIAPLMSASDITAALMMQDDNGNNGDDANIDFDIDDPWGSPARDVEID